MRLWQSMLGAGGHRNEDLPSTQWCFRAVGGDSATRRLFARSDCTAFSLGRRAADQRGAGVAAARRDGDSVGCGCRLLRRRRARILGRHVVLLLRPALAAQHDSVLRAASGALPRLVALPRRRLTGAHRRRDRDGHAGGAFTGGVRVQRRAGAMFGGRASSPVGRPALARHPCEGLDFHPRRGSCRTDIHRIRHSRVRVAKP
jgi:hypothetical protein